VINVAMLDWIRRLLRDRPDLHDQNVYACGTAGCIAGWAKALDAGLTVGEDIALELQRIRMCSPERVLDFQEWAYVEGQRILGLSDAEARAVFILSGYEAEALALVDAIIDREKGELTAAGRAELADYGLPVEPAGGAA
jgi:hypothetical protein